jgi:hypothetical protein
MSSYEYYRNDGGDDHAQPPDTNNNYAAYDNSENKSLPQHHGLLQTPHGAMTEIVATAGSSVLPPSQLQRQSPTTQQTNNNRPEAAVVKKSLRIKAAKHFHTRAVVGNDGNNNISSSSRDPDGMVLVNPYSISSSSPPKEIEAPSKVAAIRSSNKKYPQQHHNDHGDTSMSTNDLHTSSNENGTYNSIAKHNNSAVTSIQPPSSITSRNYYNSNNVVVVDDPAIEIYDDSAPSSDIGSGYNSGSDLENAARKILRRSRAAAAGGGGGGTSHRRSTRNNNGGYNSDCSLSDTGSAISSTTSSSAIRKLPEGWKERIKRKAMSGNNSKMNGVKLPPTMDKEKTKAEKLKLRQQQQQQQQQQQVKEQQQQHYQHKEPEEMPIEDERDDGDPYYDNYNAITGGRGGGAYNDESDDDEYFQDHFNGSAGAFPSFSNDYDNNNNYHVKHDDFIDEQQQQPQYYDDAVNPQSSSSSYFIDHPPIIEQHVFGPILPSTIYESNDEYEDEEDDDDKEHRRRKKDGPLFQNDWNPNAFITNTSSSSPSSSSPTRKKNGDDFVPIEEIDESGFPSPSRRKATSKVGESGFPSPSRKTNAAQEVDESSSFPSPSGKTNSIPQAVDETGFPSASPKSKLLQDQSEQMATIDGSIDSLHNEFNKDDYFHDFTSNNVDDWVPPSGVQWKSSTKRGTAAAAPPPPPRSPVVTDYDILATFSGEKEEDDNNDLPNVSTWSESPFRDDFGVFAKEEEKKEGNEEGSQQRIVVKLPPLHQQSKPKDKASPAMNPFSTEDLSDVENPDAAGNATDATTTSPSRKGLNFFKRKGKGRLYHSEGEKTDSEYDTDVSKKSARLKALSPLRRKNNKKKTAKKTEFVTKKSETRRNLFGGPTRVEKKSSPTNAKNTPSAQNPRWFENKVVATTPVVKLKGTPRDTATPIVSNIKSTCDTKPFASVKVYEGDDAADDGTVSTLGSIVTKESSLNIKAKLMSSNASANTAVSEIQRLRRENDKLRQELEKQTIESIRTENERLRQQLLERKAANAAAAAPHRTRSFADSLTSGESRTVGDSTLRTVGDSAYDGSLLRVKRNARDGMHKSTLSSLLKSDVKVNSRRSPRHHRITVTKNNLMNQADFDDDSVTIETYSQRKPNQRYEFRKEFTGPSLACATEWMATQARNAAEGKGPRAMDCFTACSRKDRGQRRRRRRNRGTHDINDSDTDDSITDMGDDSLRRDSRPKPRTPIARKKAPNRFEERLL